MNELKRMQATYMQLLESSPHDAARLIKDIDQKYLEARGLQQEKENLIVASVYMYESAIRKIDVKMDELKIFKQNAD